MFIPARMSSGSRGDRIGPPPNHSGRLTPAPHEGPRSRQGQRRDLAVDRFPSPPRLLGEGRGIVGSPAPRPAAGTPAATPHVRGGLLFDNPVSAVVKVKQPASSW